MIRVCVESPLRSDVARNALYAKCCMLDCLLRGEAPYLGHLLYPLVLDDTVPNARELGIAAHLAWMSAAELIAIYTDLTITDGMTQAVQLAAELRIPHAHRTLGPDWATRLGARIARTPGF